MAEHKGQANQTSQIYAKSTAEMLLILTKSIRDALRRVSKDKADDGAKDASKVADKLTEWGEPTNKDKGEEKAENSGDSIKSNVDDTQTEQLKNEWTETVKDVNENPEKLEQPGKPQEVAKKLKGIEEKIGPEATLAAVYKTMDESPAFKQNIVKEVPELNQTQSGQKEKTNSAFDSSNLDASEEDAVVVGLSLEPNSKGSQSVAQTSKPEPSYSSPNVVNTAYTTPDAVYPGENFNVEVKDNIRTITDKTGNIIFQFNKEGNKIEVIHNKLTASHKELFKKVRGNIDNVIRKDGNLSAVMKDSSGVNQVNMLGGLAPEGSHAIAVSKSLIQPGKSEVVSRSYTFTKQEDNTYAVYRNNPKDGENKTLAISKPDGKIIVNNQTPQELASFQKAYQDARNKVSVADMSKDKVVSKPITGGKEGRGR